MVFVEILLELFFKTSDFFNFQPNFLFLSNTVADSLRIFFLFHHDVLPTTSSIFLITGQEYEKTSNFQVFELHS